MEFPLSSEDKMEDKEQNFPNKFCFFMATYATDENAFIRNEGLNSHKIRLKTLFEYFSLQTSRSVNNPLVLKHMQQVGNDV